jgi:DNA-binding NtrC family response regulator
MTDMIDVTDLPPLAQQSARAAGAGQAATAAPALAEPGQSLEEHEKQLVMDALKQAGGNQSKAARQLRIGRDALRYKMKKFGLL